MKLKSLMAIPVAAMLAASPVRAEGILPLFDTHVHFSKDAWSSFEPAQILDMLKKAGVVMGAFSSTPDDGTLKLYELNPTMVAPMLRPYRDDINSSNWFADQETVAYLKQRLAKGIYVGVGEFHLFDARSALTPQVKELADEVVKRDLYLQIHAGAFPIAAMYTVNPKLKIIWAHMGMSDGPKTVDTMLEKYPSLMAEVALRGGDIALGGQLDPEWRRVILKYPDRFLMGTDTWVTSRWPEYIDLVEEHRNWIKQLPPEVAENVAFRNAVRIFGINKRGRFPD
jgi:predicted TIM-barrel fold metal-dependent hydrolase